MYLFIVALHVVLCIFLILIILLQPGKGGDVGAAFGGGGGGGGSFFGPRGPATLLSRATTAVAVMFMFTSITLSLYSNRKVMEDANTMDEIERLQQEEELKKQQEAGGSTGETMESGESSETP